MALGIYAGTTANGVTLLPSPISVTPSREIIWSQDTGRSSTGKMIGDIVAEKMTYNIKWGILPETSVDHNNFNNIKDKLTAGFFYFAMAPDLGTAKSNAKKFYRSEITYDMIQAGSGYYYKDIAVSVIEQ